MPEPGDKIDRFEVEALVGRGGMAAVYRVRHTTLGSAHALKVLDLPFRAIQRRLVLEGRVQAQLAHPNIVSVTDLIEVEGAPGLIMEYVPGRSLDGWLADNRPDPATIEQLFGGVLDAMVHAHGRGLVHRDLKPGNVLVQVVDGRFVPKVSDFGLAKLLSDDDDGPGRTRTGLAMGTPGYMAPEQIRSAKDVDQRADVFALGCLLYELWCGAPPFAPGSVYDVLVAIEARAFAPPREVRPDMPEGVAEVITACLEPDPERRIASAELVRQRLYPHRSVPEGRRSDPAPPLVQPAPAPAARTTPVALSEPPPPKAPTPLGPATPPRLPAPWPPPPRPGARPRRGGMGLLRGLSVLMIVFGVVGLLAVGVIGAFGFGSMIVLFDALAAIADTGR